MSPNESRTVWSSEEGDLRKKKENFPSAASLPQHQQTAYLHRDSKGRAGKGVILIKNLHLSQEDMSTLSKRIKQGCGVGGTVKDSRREPRADRGCSAQVGLQGEDGWWMNLIDMIIFV
jgi:translation initiation factor 1